MMLKRVSCLLGFAALLLSSPGGQAAGLTVIRLHVSRPGIAGRFATADCTVKNTGPQAVPLKALAAALETSTGTDVNFAVSPPNPPLASVLKPGQIYRFRQFQQMPTSGKFMCGIRAENPDGQWTLLHFADGRLATAPLDVVPEAEVSRVHFQVFDPHPRHIYAAGATITLHVLPLLTGGPDLSSQIASVQITPAAKPYSISPPASARDLLTGGDFQADFWGVPNTQRALDVVVKFAHPVSLQSWSLSGQDLNNLYGMTGCTAQVLDEDGASTSCPALIVRNGSSWTVYSASPRPVTAAAISLHTTTPYKINLTRLTLAGTATPKDVLPPVTVRAQWQDMEGHPLSASRTLPLYQKNAVTSPPHLGLGYAALVLTTTIPGQDPARREFGFAVLPPPTGDHDPRLGLVHMDLSEPNLGVGWVKTLGTNFFNEQTFTLDAAGWQQAIAARRAQGLRELPLMADDDWNSDSTKPVSAARLQRIHDKMLQYFRATPDVSVWELGLEENLQYRGQRAAWKYYWPNLAAKANAVRQAAVDAQAHIRLIYQIAETDPQTVTEFCRSDASHDFDILSLHPYAWPDFPAPERWMPPYLAQVRAAMARYHAEKPIWFSEIGAPLNGNPGGFFGYPSIPAFDRGLSRAEQAAYLVKCHLIAFSLGVKKVFWYTYQDGGDDPEYAEDHFGMIDFRGYPQPSYVAYSTMARMLYGKKFVRAEIFPSGIRADLFHGAGKDTWAVWTNTAQARTVPLAALGISPTHVQRVVSLLGRTIPLKQGHLGISGNPQYIIVGASSLKKTQH